MHEKGEYHNEMKQEYWKTYNQDGTVKSVSFFSNDSLTFYSEDGSDYIKKGIHVEQLKTIFVVPKNWKPRSLEESYFVLACVKVDTNRFSPNINVVSLPLGNQFDDSLEKKTLDSYLEKKKEVIEDQYQGELVYYTTNPYFPEKQNYFLKCRITSDSLLITSFIFVFIKEKNIIEVNLACNSKDEILYEDLARELVTSIQFDGEGP